MLQCARRRVFENMTEGWNFISDILSSAPPDAHPDAIVNNIQVTGPSGISIDRCLQILSTLRSLLCRIGADPKAGHSNKTASP